LQGVESIETRFAVEPAALARNFGLPKEWRGPRNLSLENVIG